MEKIHTVLLYEGAAVLLLKDVQAVFLLNEVGHSIYSLDAVRNFHKLLVPLGVYFEAEFLKARLVVWIVIESGKWSYLIEPVDQKAFLIHIGKSERSYYGVHSIALSPQLDSVDESSQDVYVVDEVKPAESYCLRMSYLI